MLRILSILLLWALSATDLYAQTTVRPCVTTSATQCPPVSASNPLPITGSFSAAIIGKTTTEVAVTISVTNTFQAALASNATRTGCLIQNNGTNKAYVFFGSATPGGLTTSFQLTAGNAISCAVGGIAVATDQVLVTGTSGDVLTVSEQ